MITYGNKELRNLEEQVLKNKQDIAKHYQATQLPANLAGITVIGRIYNPTELDDVIGEQFGDAYVQVVGEDTILWIWTRSNPDAGEDTNYWLDIPFTTVGEQGPRGEIGPKGDTGERGNRWYSMDHAPGTEIPEDAIPYDIWFNYTTGNIWHLHETPAGLKWLQEGSIKGAQGPQGPQGPTGPKGNKGDTGLTGLRGPAGSSVQIVGILSSVSQLTGVTPTSTNEAYLVGPEGNYDIYLYSTSSSQWYNAGPFNAGTQVIADSVLVKTWDADTKVDKVTTSGANKLYGVNSVGEQKTYILRPDPKTTDASYKHQLVQYDVTSGKSVNNGLIRISEVPIEPYHTASKAYVDSQNRYYNTQGTLLLDDLYQIYFSTVDSRQVIDFDSWLTLHFGEYIPVTGYTTTSTISNTIMPVAIQYTGIEEETGNPMIQVYLNTGVSETATYVYVQTFSSRIL